MVIVFNDNRDDGDTGTDRQMESTFLQWQHIALRGEVAGSLRENPGRHFVVLDEVSSFVEALDSRSTVSSVDKDGAGEHHEGTKGSVLERIL